MPNKGTFSVEKLRAAVRERVEETSIRAVADEIGMSPSGLHVLLSGSRPHPKTRDKLLSWYLASRGTKQAKNDVSADDADTAVRLLRRYIAAELRPDSRKRRLEAIVASLERSADGE